MSHPRNAIKRSHDIALSQREIILRTPRSRLSTCRFGREFESHFQPAGENGGREEGFSRQEELRLNFITQDLTTMSFHTALFVEKVPTKMPN